MSKRDYPYIHENLKQIRQRIAEAALKSGRSPEDIALMAVTKTVDADRICYAVEQGITLIGENRVQELLSKREELPLDRCELQLIGHLQTNKVKYIIPSISTIQSLDNEKLAGEISRLSQKHGVTTRVLVEVNIGKEESKRGVMPEETVEFIQKVSILPGIHVAGLMSIPPICDSDKKIRTYFSDLYKLFVDIRGEKIDNISMDILSMGMSDDYDQAILEGATMVRIGSALFGERVG